MKKLLIYGAIAYLVYDLFLKDNKNTGNKNDYTIQDENFEVPKPKQNDDYNITINPDEVIKNGVIVYK